MEEVKLMMEIETGEARQSVTDKDGEYSYLYTDCRNWWYSVKTNPMSRDGCICPKCGRIIRVIVPR